MCPSATQVVRAARLGYAPASQTVTVTTGQTVTVTLQMTATAIQLEGIVTVGYGSQSRREVTGAVSTIKADVLQQVVGGNALDAIKGRVPGVDITATSFDPGATQNIRIRGTRSITAGNNPLYVVDGVPITGDLRDIDQNSIESIDVLKDASAASVYGSRGANGVVMITTKRGGLSALRTSPLQHVRRFANPRASPHDVRPGVRQLPPRVIPQFQYGVVRDRLRELRGKPDDLRRSGTRSDDARQPRRRVNTNWQDLMLRDGNLQNTQLGFSGGNGTTRFRMGLGFLGQNGINIVQGYTARTGSFNVSHNQGRLDLQLGVQGVQNHRDVGRGSVMWDEALFNPALGRNVDSTGRQVFLPTEDGLLVNPVMAAQAYQRGIDRTNVLGTLTGPFDLSQGLKFNVAFGPQLTNQTDGELIGIYTRQKRGTGAPDATARRTQNNNYTLSNFLDFDRTLASTMCRPRRCTKSQTSRPCSTARPRRSCPSTASCGTTSAPAPRRR